MSFFDVPDHLDSVMRGRVIVDSDVLDSLSREEVSQILNTLPNPGKVSVTIARPSAPKKRIAIDVATWARYKVTISKITIHLRNRR